MTKFWGPLGWMTLHSISVCYPDHPSPEEKEILKRFITLFANTITCNYCKGHFRRMFSNYLSAYPEMFDTRFELFKFVILAHNTVNLRLDKPRPKSVRECLDTLIANTRDVSASGFRTSYINYLVSNWTREYGGEGMIFKRDALEMRKINEQYWETRDVKFEDVVMPEFDVLVPIEKVEPRIRSPFTTIAKPIGFHGGRIRR
jgi:hypothetical protein